MFCSSERVEGELGGLMKCDILNCKLMVMLKSNSAFGFVMFCSHVHLNAGLFLINHHLSYKFICPENLKNWSYKWDSKGKTKILLYCVVWWDVKNAAITIFFIYIGFLCKISYVLTSSADSVTHLDFAVCDRERQENLDWSPLPLPLHFKTSVYK